MKVGDKTFKVHLDGYNFQAIPERRRRRGKPRKEDLLLPPTTGDLTAIKVQRLEAQLQNHQGKSIYRHGGVDQRPSRYQTCDRTLGERFQDQSSMYHTRWWGRQSSGQWFPAVTLRRWIPPDVQGNILRAR